MECRHHEFYETGKLASCDERECNSGLRLPKSRGWSWVGVMGDMIREEEVCQELLRGFREEKQDLVFHVQRIQIRRKDKQSVTHQYCHVSGRGRDAPVRDRQWEWVVDCGDSILPLVVVHPRRRLTTPMTRNAPLAPD